MAITFRQLEHFLALSEELHFGNAARKLNISQPPLSTSLKQLEDTLGFPLMLRSNRSVQLTDAGAVFARHAARLLSQLDQAQAIAAQTARGATGSLTVSFVSSMLFRNLPAALQRFEEAHPNVALSLREMNTADQIAAVARGEVDVGFIHGAPLPDTVAEEVLETERLVCCVPQGHRLAGRGRIAPAALAGERVFVFAREHAESNYDRIAELLAGAGLSIHDGFKLRNWFTVVTLVGQGMGVSIVPKPLSRLAFGEVAYVDLDGPQAEHRVSMISPAAGGAEIAQDFMRFVRLSNMGRITDPDWKGLADRARAADGAEEEGEP